MKIYLALQGNYHNLNEYREVSSWQEAQSVWREVRDAEEIGARDMLDRCGYVYDDEYNRIGHISYNGRAWDMDVNEILPISSKATQHETTAPQDRETITDAQRYIARVESLHINQFLLDLFAEHRINRIDPTNPAVTFQAICETQFRESEYLGGMAEAICAQLQAEDAIQ